MAEFQFQLTEESGGDCSQKQQKMNNTECRDAMVSSGHGKKGNKQKINSEINEKTKSKTKNTKYSEKQKIGHRGFHRDPSPVY